MNILNLIATTNYITVNRTIAEIVGLEAAVVLGELASEATYWREHNPDYDGSFYSTIENLEKRTYLSGHNQRLALNKLQEQGWVTVEKRGMPAKRYIRIHEEEIARVVNDKSLKILTTSDEKNEQQVVKNFNANKNISKKNRKEEKNKGDSTPAVVDDSKEETYRFKNQPITGEDVEELLELCIAATPYTLGKIKKDKMAALWMDEFGGTRADVMHEAIRNHIATSKFFPTPAEIKQQIARVMLTIDPDRLIKEGDCYKQPVIPEEVLKLFQETEQ